MAQGAAEMELDAPGPRAADEDADMDAEDGAQETCEDDGEKAGQQQQQQEEQQQEEQQQQQEQQQGEERMCRFCFEGEEEEPLRGGVCACKGDQRYVHMGCLRRWQRMVLVSQPTHPAFYRDDVRHHVCGVCKSKFTCPPPTRLELMQSFTGAEIAALIGKGRFIAARGMFSEMLEKELDSSPALSIMSSYAHWVRSAYLITSVEDDNSRIEMEVDSAAELAMLQQLVVRARAGAAGDGASFEFGGRTYELAAEGALAGVAADKRAEALADLEAPCVLVFEGEKSSAHDTIQAVNMTRPLPAPLPPRVAATVAAARVRAQRRSAAAADVAVVCYRGGPCEEDAVGTCIVFGGPGGYSVEHGSLEDAMVLAGKRADPADAVEGLVAGQLVELHSLTKAMQHNGSRGVLAAFDKEAGRWHVQLVGGAVVNARPANVRGLSAGEKGRVLAFFGYAGWSRAQLLGEIARGHWGLCSSCLQDVCCAPNECREGLESRLVYAPESEMTDEYIKSQLRTMESLRQEAEQASSHAREAA